MISGFKSVIKVLVIVYLAYLALMLLVATPLLNLLAPRLYHAQTGQNMRVDEIIVNPFKLSLTALRAAGVNTDGSPFWSFDTLHANLSLSSLWRGYPVLDELQLLNLSLQINQTAPDRYNFTDILEHRAARQGPQPAPQPAEGPAEPPRFAVNHLVFSASHLGFHAPYLQSPLPLEAKISSLGVGMEDLSTVPPKHEDTDKRLPTLGIGTFNFDLGRFDFQSLRKEQPFETHLETLQLALKNFSTIVRPGQPYTLNVQDESGGQLHWQGDVSLAAQQASGELQLRNISLLPAWRFFAPQLAFDASRGSLDASGRYEVNWQESVRYRIDNGSVALRDIRTQARRDKDSAVNFGSFSLDGIQIDGAKRAFSARRLQLDGLDLRGWNKGDQVSLADMFKMPESREPEEPGPPWQAEIADITVRNSKIGWRASQIDAPLNITPFDLHLSEFSYPAKGAAKLDLKSTINESIKLAVNGELNPSDLNGKLSGELQGLPLTWGNAQMGQQLTAMLKGGILGARWSMELDKGNPTTVQADGQIDQFSLLRLPDHRRLLAWKQMRWQQLHVDTRAQRVTIKQVELDEPSVQFRINPDGTNNFQKLVIEHPKPGAQGHEGEHGNAAPAKAENKHKKEEAENPWLVTVDTIRPRDGTLDFRDNSMPRPFQAKIGQFGGTVTGLSSQADKSAQVDLKGAVDGYAPVTLTGTANPLAEKPSLDLALDFANLDLATLTPYSGTYAGYTIARGQLSVQLAYQLQDDRIKGRNHIVVQQMQLGERVRSPKAVDIPLRLAIALLTDSHGVMDLGVDISGNLDDPQFDLGGIIWQAFRNVIVKAVTSPFRLLANLVKGVPADQNLGEVNFAPGSDEVSNEAKSKLGNLKTALEKRPVLRVNVIGHVDPKADAEGLKQRVLTYQLRSAGVDDDDIRTQSKRWQKKIKDLYEDKFPDQETSDKTPQQMADALRDSVELKPNQLPGLAGQRALAVKRVLVTELGLPVDRIFISSEEAEKAKNAAPQVTMELDG